MCTDGWTWTFISLSQSYNKLIFLLQPLRPFVNLFCFAYSPFTLHHLQQCQGFFLELSHQDFILFTFKSDFCFCMVTWLWIFLLINPWLSFFLSLWTTEINTWCTRIPKINRWLPLLYPDLSYAVSWHDIKWKIWIIWDQFKKSGLWICTVSLFTVMVEKISLS